jgi:hypothetical protein
MEATCTQSRALDWLSKHSAIMLAMFIGWNLRPKGPRNVDGAFGPPLFERDFPMGRIS